MKYKVFSLLFFLLYFTGCGFAQKATVKSFFITSDHIPGNDRRNDLNGTPCALVKVQVVDDIERIEGNKIGAVVNKGVEKWVYLCQGSRNVRIHLKNHLPVRVMFKDFNINGLEGNRVYELLIEVSNNVSSVPVTLPQGNTTARTVTESPQTSDIRVNTQGRPEIVYAKQDKLMSVKTRSDRTKKKVKTPREAKTKDTNVKVSESMNEVAKNEPVLTWQSTNEVPTVPARLNKSFTSTYNGVTFKCKAKNGNVTIKGFNTNANDVIIPAQVIYEGKYFPVVAIDTYLIGYNYCVTNMEIQEGIKVVEKYAFSEFRNLKNVTVPKSIIEIGAKAFRPNTGLKINAPTDIDVNALLKGKTIKINRKNQ